MQRIFVFLIVILFSISAKATYILVPMEHDKQTNHLKAYGVTYWVINQGIEAYWLLNYRGGSFAFPHTRGLEAELKVRGVSYQIISDAQWISLRTDISDPELNQEAVKLEKAPKIAVYTPDFNPRGNRIQPWDDAVTLVLIYAEIPFEKVYDVEAHRVIDDVQAAPRGEAG